MCPPLCWSNPSFLEASLLDPNPQHPLALISGSLMSWGCSCCTPSGCLTPSSWSDMCHASWMQQPSRTCSLGPSPSGFPFSKPSCFTHTSHSPVGRGPQIRQAQEAMRVLSNLLGAHSSRQPFLDSPTPTCSTDTQICRPVVCCRWELCCFCTSLWAS